LKTHYKEEHFFEDDMKKSKGEIKKIELEEETKNNNEFEAASSENL